jgi:hypothetical protein
MAKKGVHCGLESFDCLLIIVSIVLLDDGTVW